jgi:hypothetical protein
MIVKLTRVSSQINRYLSSVVLVGLEAHWSSVNPHLFNEANYMNSIVCVCVCVCAQARTHACAGTSFSGTSYNIDKLTLLLLWNDT